MAETEVKKVSAPVYTALSTQISDEPILQGDVSKVLRELADEIDSNHCDITTVALFLEADHGSETKPAGLTGNRELVLKYSMKENPDGVVPN